MDKIFLVTWFSLISIFAVANEPNLSAEKRNRLLELGSIHFEAGRLTQPDYPFGNALAIYQYIIEQEPGNTIAQKQIAKIAKLCTSYAHRELETGNVSRAIYWIDQALKATPDDEDLLKLKSELGEDGKKEEVAPRLI